MKPVYWRLLPFIIFAMLAVFFWRGLSLDPQNLPSVKLGKPLPVFELPTLDDSAVKFTQNTMRGHVSLLNVWASWCEACTEEQVFLLQLAHQGVPIYGLNYKDKLDDATRWLTEWGNPYKMIGSDFRGQVAIDLGVYGAPETFLVDKSGVIRYRHAGILTALVWQREFLPRIEALEKMSGSPLPRAGEVDAQRRVRAFSGKSVLSDDTLIRPDGHLLPSVEGSK